MAIKRWERTPKVSETDALIEKLKEKGVLSNKDAEEIKGKKRKSR